MALDVEHVITKVDDILVREFELDADQVVPGANLRDDLDLDSLDAVDLIVAIEKELGFRVDDKKVMEMKTVGDIHGFIREMASHQAAPSAR